MPLTPELASRRKAERATLIARRLALSSQEHACLSAALESHLRPACATLKRAIVGFCWPYLGEFDARPVIRDLLHGGARAALPVVVGKGRPLEFREWRPDVPMIEGVYGLPVPDRTALVRPDVLLIPALGIGPDGERLGYGGGFFDRTLAALEPRPVAIAVAFDLSRVDSIEPQPHDVLMDFVVTESGVAARGARGLAAIGAGDCARRIEALLAERGAAPQPVAAARSRS